MDGTQAAAAGAAAGAARGSGGVTGGDACGRPEVARGWDEKNNDKLKGRAWIEEDEEGAQLS